MGKAKKPLDELFVRRLKVWQKMIRRGDVAREFPSVTLLGGPSLMSAEPDGCHPNEKGMAEIARNLAKRLMPPIG